MARNKKKAAAGKNKGVLDHPISNANGEEMESKSTTTESKSPAFLFCLFLDKSPYNMSAVADAEYKYFKLKVRRCVDVVTLAVESCLIVNECSVLLYNLLHPIKLL